MLSKKTIQNELSKVQQQMKRKDISDRALGEMYGAQQAICWILEDNAEAPSKII